MTITAPQFDECINSLQGDSLNFSQETVEFPSNLRQSLIEIINLLPKIEYKEDDSDKKWKIWFKLPRGKISDFGNPEDYIEEGFINDKTEFQNFWIGEYPEEDCWYHVGFTQIRDEQLFININSKKTVGINLLEKALLRDYALCDGEKAFFKVFFNILIKTFREIIKDSKSYCLQIENELPYRFRFGVINRKLIWENIKDVERLDKVFSKKDFSDLSKIVNQSSSIKENLIEDMTLNKFLKYCEIGYDANNYFLDNKIALSPLEKYKKMADGRHDGLLDIKPNSPSAFREWFENHLRGGHPWEICRGGNSTHISLHVNKEQDQWKLLLEGSSKVRVTETVNMALALYHSGIPFVLRNSKEVLRMVKGDDYVGIVPIYITPEYCTGLFPKKFQVFDCINPWIEKDLAKFLITKATWLPVFN